MTDTDSETETYATVNQRGAHERVVRYNIPREGVRLKTSGDTAVTYYIDVQEEGVPTPNMFQDISDAATKLVVLSTFLPEAYQDEALDLYNRVERLKRLLARERFDDDQAVSELCYAGIGELPEVTVETEHVTVDEDYDGDIPGGES